MTLQEKIKGAPDKPGCYLFKDKNGFVIYVGKSKRLRNRVAQYFRKSGQKDDRHYILAKEIADVEYRITETEIEALVLEYQLIKQYKPWFNIKMKPDKERFALRIDPLAACTYPAITITTEAPSGKGAFFGYFYNEDDVQEALYILHRAFQTPVCGKSSFDTVSNTCLRGHMGTCLAPCAHTADPEKYRAAVKEAMKLLRGNNSTAMNRLKKEMADCSAAMAFEKAGELNALIRDMERLQARSRNKILKFPTDRDTVVFLQAYREDQVLLIYFVAKGNVGASCLLDKKTTCGFASVCLDPFIQQIVAADQTPPSNPALAACLLEVGSKKQFLILPKKYNKEKLRELLLKEVDRFSVRTAGETV